MDAGNRSGYLRRRVTRYALEMRKMKWIEVSDALPAMVETSLRISDTVLCQSRSGNTFLAYVRYYELGEFDPVWARSGGDTHGVNNIVRWIPLRDILDQIS